MRTPLPLAGILLVSLALTGCATGDPSPDESAPVSPPSSDTAQTPVPADDDGFCSDFDANGGSLATVGAPPAFYPKEQLLEYSDETLGVIGDLTPPDEIAEPFGVYLDYQERLRAAAEQLPAGGTLSDPALVTEATELTDEYEAVSEYISANC